jgi:hypothetical protein
MIVMWLGRAIENRNEPSHVASLRPHCSALAWWILEIGEHGHPLRTMQLCEDGMYVGGSGSARSSRT